MSGFNFEPPPGWEELGRRLQEQLEPMRESMAQASAAFAQLQERISVQLGPLADIGRRLVETWKESLAPNWAHFTAASEISAVIERVDETGFCLVWLPPAEILDEVIEAPAAQTGAILVRHKTAILEHGRLLLLEIDDPELEPERSAAADALVALEHGHKWPAQALASSVLTSIIHRRFDVRRIGKGAQRLEETHPEEAALLEVRLRTIYLAASRALADYNPRTDDPPHPAFNRHNTAHRITLTQWTEASALGAVMLVVAFVRELQYWAYRAEEDLASAV